MDYALVSLVVTGLLSIGSAVLTSKYFKLKGKAGAIIDLLAYTMKAVEDNELNEEELKNIVTLSQKILETQ